MRCEFQGRRLAIVLDGEHDLAPLRRVLAEALDDPRFEAPMRIVIDASRSRANPPVSEIRDIIEYFLRIRDRFEPEWTVVVTDPLRYGLARMGSAFADAHGLSINVVKHSARADPPPKPSE